MIALFSRLLCTVGMHKWGDWDVLGPTDGPVRLNRRWVTLHVPHYVRGCERCPSHQTWEAT